MSIATEIEDLNTNLQAAKEAVVAKGGAVGDTGLAGLATEIESIPAGEPELTSDDYGIIGYLDKIVLRWPPSTSDYNCVVTVVDENKAAKMRIIFPESEDFYFNLTGENEWTTDYGDIYTTDELLSVWGLSVSNIEEGASFDLFCYPTYDATAPCAYYKISSLQDFEQLYQEVKTFSGLPSPIGADAITMFRFGEKCPVNIGDNFLQLSSNLTYIDFSRCGHIETIGDHFLSACPISYKVPGIGEHFTNLVSIGDYFLAGTNVIFYKDMGSANSFPRLRSVGNSFLSNTCIDTFQTYGYFPSLETIGDNALYSCKLLSTIDLNSTALTSVGSFFAQSCDKLISVSIGSHSTNLASVGITFLGDCGQLMYVNMSVSPVGIFNPTSGDSSFCTSDKVTNPKNASSILGRSISGNATYANELMQIFPEKIPTTGTYGTYRKWRTQ